MENWVSDRSCNKTSTVLLPRAPCYETCLQQQRIQILSSTHFKFTHIECYNLYLYFLQEIKQLALKSIVYQNSTVSIREQINLTPSLLKGKGIMKPFKGKIMSYVNCFVKLPLKCASVQQNCNTWSINFSITLWSISASNQSTWLMDWKNCYKYLVHCVLTS